MIKNNNMIDLEDLRAEYESTYLHYWNKDNPILNFKQWLKEEKGIVIIKKDKL